jgi:hypothetical protein
MEATPKASPAAPTAAFVSALAVTLGAAYSPPARSQEGGVIKGSVVYTGAVPTKKVIPKDPEVCGEPHSEPQIVVDANKGVKDAIVYLEGVAKAQSMSKPAKPAVIDNKNCSFVPESQIVAPGPIEIVNNDPVLHNTHGFYGKRTAFNVALPNQGQRVTKDLPRSGLVRVECDEHGHMHATVYVADHPYHAVTAADGAFTIKDVPPGNYKLIVYQRHTGPIETAVSVKAKETTDVKVDLKQ